MKCGEHYLTQENKIRRAQGCTADLENDSLGWSKEEKIVLMTSLVVTETDKFFELFDHM